MHGGAWQFSPPLGARGRKVCIPRAFARPSGLTGKGSLPITARNLLQFPVGFVVFQRSAHQPEEFPGECPERQRGRTVNPLAMPSQVRVLPPPPAFACSASCGSASRWSEAIEERIGACGCSSMVEQEPSKLNLESSLNRAERKALAPLGKLRTLQG